MYKINNNFKTIEVSVTDAGDVRRFCLQQIKNEYGYDYNKEWHRDLDSLLLENGDYSKSNRGIFLISKFNNKIVGSCGLRDLKFKVSNYKLCKDYFHEESVASLWRTYVKKDFRNKGIATKLVEDAIEKASAYKYKKVYLHTSSKQPQSVQFWSNRGFNIFHEENNSDKTVHMIKNINN